MVTKQPVSAWCVRPDVQPVMENLASPASQAGELKWDAVWLDLTAAILVSAVIVIRLLLIIIIYLCKKNTLHFYCFTKE